jgi:hypothetical protein
VGYRESGILIEARNMLYKNDGIQGTVSSLGSRV